MSRLVLQSYLNAAAQCPRLLHVFEGVCVHSVRAQSARVRGVCSLCFQLHCFCITAGDVSGLSPQLHA